MTSSTSLLMRRTVLLAETSIRGTRKGSRETSEATTAEIQASIMVA